MLVSARESEEFVDQLSARPTRDCRRDLLQFAGEVIEVGFVFGGVGECQL